MPMREECKNYQSRTYASGEVARFCVLDLAPEAPWRCPENCPAYQRRYADAGWTHGSLVEPKIEDEPDEPGSEVAGLLDEAEDIVNAVLPEARAEAAAAERRREAAARGGPWQVFRRLRRRGGGGGGGGGPSGTSRR
ncbi:MAG TPA: hypothetical protein VMD59_18815 [Acidimicrobiales bacterium]|nr:hypothetical protein [Acidimicrobiales bacterium]